MTPTRGGLATDESGSLWIAAPDIDRIYRIAPTGGVHFYTTVPGAREVATYGDSAYVATRTNQVWHVSPGGGLTELMDPSGDGTTPLIEPRSIATDDSGAVYVTSHGSHSVFRLRPDGSVMRVMGVTANQLAVTAEGTLYVTDADNNLFYRGERSDGVLDNDTDPDDDLISSEVLDDVVHGNLVIEPDGSFTYTPNPSFAGVDTFTYQATDSIVSSPTITATIHVVANHSPVASDDPHSVDNVSTLSVPAPGVLGNDFDADGDRITAWLVTGPSHGTLDLEPDGSFTYEPSAGYQGADNFRYQVLDIQGNRDEATVTINVVVGVDCVVDIAGGGDYATISAALTDANCVDIAVAPGIYSEFLRITPGMGERTIHGAGEQETTINGSIRVMSGDRLTLRHLTLTGSASARLINSSSFVSIEDSTISGNYVNGVTAVYNVGSLWLIRTSIVNNEQQGYDVVRGSFGPVANFGSLVILDSLIADNDGLSNWWSNSSAGGILSSVGSTLAVSNSTLSGNAALYGGAILSLGETVLSNVTITNNNARHYGALLVLGGSTRINNSIVSGNSSNSHRGVDCFVEVAAGLPGASLSSDGANLIGDLTGCDYVPGAGDIIGVDPLLGPLADNGGPTLTHALLPGSPAIDAGISTLATDQRGVARPQGAAPDIGAYEHIPDEDSDGVSDPIEDGAPNDGDGNSDGVPDRDQTNVASLPNAVTGEYVTLETGDPISDVATTVPPMTPPEGVEMPVGLMSFVVDPLSTSELTVTLFLPLDARLDAYWKYGPTTGNPDDHWYQFMYDGTTGAVINHEADRTVIVLHYVDGQRGDADLTANSRLVDPGGPVIILNQPPVANDDDYSIDEDTPLTIEAPGVLANDTDEDGDPITAVLVDDAEYGELTLNDDSSFSYTPDPDWFGDDTFTYRAHDGELYSNAATVTIEVIPVNDLPVGTATPAEQTVQYSDPIEPVTIEVDDIDSNTVSVTSTGLPDGVVIASSPCDVPCSLTISGTATAPAGTYEATITFDDGTDTTDVGVTIIVEPEDAVVVFEGANEVAFHVDEAGGTGNVELSALVREAVPDLPPAAASPGDIANAEVTMTLAPVGPGSNVSGACLPGTVTGIGYGAILPVTCTFTEVEVNIYTVEAVLTGGYYVSSTVEDVVVVYDPSLGFTTGGGWFYWPGTTDKTNFGYTMKYNKNFQKVKGNLLLIRHLEDESIYRVKSNALYGLALGEGDGFGWATFSGKATYLEPGIPEPEGNHEFMLYVEDYGKPGIGVDQVWLEMRDKSGNIILALSMPRPAISNTTAISGGNIVVPH